MPRIPQSFIDELISRSDIVELIGSRLELKKKGREYTACCPFHGEKTPSFTVSQNKQFYHCFGCGAHGTVISFLMEYDNLGFVEAIEELAQRAGLEVPQEVGQADRSDTNQRLYLAQQMAAEHFAENLRRSPEAIDYLKNRGLTGNIARDYQLGFALDRFDDLMPALLRQFSEKELLTAGLLTRKDGGKPYDRFRGRIMFPIRDTRGRVVGFGGRVLAQQEPKYLNTAETPIFHKGRQLYGLYEARKASPRLESLLVVEGYMDVIALAQYGIKNAVATLGTATTHEHVERLLRVVPKIVFCFDGDRAGKEAAWRALEQALPSIRDGVELRFLLLPEGEDPDTLVRQLGTEAFVQQVQAATPLSDMLIQGLGERFDQSSREGRAALGLEAVRLLRLMPEGLLRSQIISDIAPLAGVSSAELNERLGKAESRPATTPAPPKRPSGQRRSGLSMNPVRMAITLLLEDPGLAKAVKDFAWLAEIELPGVDILLALLETLSKEPHLNTAQLLERWREHEWSVHLHKLAEKSLPGVAEEDRPVILRDALGRLTEQADSQQANELLNVAQTRSLSAEEKQTLQAILSRRGHK
ncbi:DNA primase [Ectothiorhodosinus mongolicus]|uniref:DNA primase n=1 Tax=Ectothiorhodosinus mongolicus TaxID=233100 RepID=A0A1R3VUU1_9GAMM|nr:DNA primase [Ectothiorhodosinus mongolicus]ULX56877.1 DNA primase [Ectothiorhodosinus mongolicus]SIT68770.1 DNA primase [Ectothiorhodosinus mongolicus]